MKKTLITSCSGIIASAVLLTGCIDLRIIEDLQRKIWRAQDARALKAFYAKETAEQKALRDENRKICFDISGAYSGNWDQILYDDCMTERGSPLP